jgi:hypothetical protein
MQIHVTIQKKDAKCSLAPAIAPKPGAYWVDTESDFSWLFNLTVPHHHDSTIICGMDKHLLRAYCRPLETGVFAQDREKMMIHYSLYASV